MRITKVEITIRKRLLSASLPVFLGVYFQVFNNEKSSNTYEEAVNAV